MNPKKMYHVSETQLSIARYYGGCIFNGKQYIYNPDDDTLTREDVFKKENKIAKETRRLEKHQWDCIDRVKDLF